MKLSRKNKQNEILFWSIIGLFLISLLHNLGLQPLFQEEPRRALIALEMIFNKNFIVPTEFGEFYYKKPPVWNWLIIAGYGLFGVNEFAIRFFSAFSFLLMGLAVFFWVKNNSSTQHAIFSSLFFLVSVDIYFYFSSIGEIDIFYSLVTLLSFITIFEFFKNKKFLLLFLATYTLAAIGFLTKAFPTVIFTGVTLITTFIYRKEFRKLFSFQHVAGIGVFVIIVGSYFMIYNQYNNALEFIEVLWSRSSKRTLIEEESKSLLLHMINFPLKTWINLLPASFFILLLFFRKSGISYISDPLIRFSLLVFGTNFLIYLISPGSRDRYIYMLYPLPIIAFSYWFLQGMEKSRNFSLIFKVFVIVIAASGLVVSLGLNFIDDMKGSSGIWIISVAFAFIFAGLLAISFKSKGYSIGLLLVILLISMRFLFNLTVIPQRTTNSDALDNKIHAYAILEKTEGEPVYLYNYSTCSRITIFYLEKELSQVVSRSENFEKGKYYIIHDKIEVKQSNTELYTFSDMHKRSFRLIRID